MLKHKTPLGVRMRYSAAFGRLSVETIELELIDDYGMAAAFGRLSVETGTGGQVSAA